MTQKIQTGSLRTHHCGELTQNDIGKKVALCGWMTKYRDLGGIHFIDLRDKYGITQLGFDHFQGDIHELKKISLESSLMVHGEVVARPSDAQNKKMKTGEVEVQVRELKILSQAQLVPFLPHGVIDATEDLRLKYRYLDIRTNHLQNILSLRSNTARQTREILYAEGFTEIETPILYKSTPEGARDYIVPSRVHKHKVYALPQSPQTLKQLLMIGNTDRYFQLCKCFRDEDLRADRQPEFTQVDIEASYITPEFIKALAEKLVKKWYGQDDSFVLESMDYQTAMKLYGTDKPDTRFDLFHLEVTELFRGSGFSTFEQVSKNNGLIKAIFIPSSLGVFSRKDIDGLTEVVKPFGGKGVAWFKNADSGRTGGISKFISDDLFQKLQLLAKDNSEGTWFFFADNNSDVAHACADVVRRELAKKLDLIKEGYSFLWVYDFPLLEYDDQSKRFYAKHHPFTMLHQADLDNFFSNDPEKLKAIRAQAYDLVCNGYELGGGSIRIHDTKVQSQMFKVLGMSDAEVLHQFGFFIEALKFGTPPHGGIAFGLDRIVMLQAKTDNIRDVIAFPKTTKASDLMAQAPSDPDTKQIKELFFKWD